MTLDCMLVGGMWVYFQETFPVPLFTMYKSLYYGRICGRGEYALSPMCSEPIRTAKQGPLTHEIYLDGGDFAKVFPIKKVRAISGARLMAIDKSHLPNPPKVLADLDDQLVMYCLPDIIEPVYRQLLRKAASVVCNGRMANDKLRDALSRYGSYVDPVQKSRFFAGMSIADKLLNHGNEATCNALRFHLGFEPFLKEITFQIFYQYLKKNSPKAAEQTKKEIGLFIDEFCKYTPKNFNPQRLTAKLEEVGIYLTLP